MPLCVSPQNFLPPLLCLVNAHSVPLPLRAEPVTLHPCFVDTRHFLLSSTPTRPLCSLKAGPPSHSSHPQPQSRPGTEQSFNKHSCDYLVSYQGTWRHALARGSVFKTHQFDVWWNMLTLSPQFNRLLKKKKKTRKEKNINK